jgi:hypothetical protein
LVDEFDTQTTAGHGERNIGAVFAVDRWHTLGASYNVDFVAGAAGYISHELHHAYVPATAPNHHTDTNGNGVPAEADDQLRVLWDYNHQYPFKRLLADIDAAATVIRVSKTSDMTETGRIDIDGELIDYTGIGINGELTGCIRGAGAVPHTVLFSFVRSVDCARDHMQIRYGRGTTQYIDLT